jgi:superfamily II DNA or RNA helicase
MSKTAYLKILDECNCKFVNLDLDVRKALVRKFKYEDPSARFRPSYKLGRWDGAISFFGLGGTTYISMLPEILEFLENKNYYIEVEDQRTSENLSFPKISEDFWGEKCWPVGHARAGELIKLRDYQVDVINKFLENPQCLQEVSTGAGKTIITAALSKICEKYGRTVTIVPNKSLVEQTEEDFVNCGLDVGVYYGDRKELNRTHTICTWQSLNILDKKSLKVDDDEVLTLAEFLEGVNCIIVDEVHMAKAAILQKLLTKNFANAPIRWGLTGTIPKAEHEYQALRASLGDVINRVSAHELQEKGVLSKCHVNIIQTAEWKEFESYASELKYLVTDETRMEYLSSLIQGIAETGNTLVLVDRIESGKFLQASLTEKLGLQNGDNEVAFVSGEVKTKDRKDEYDEIKTSTNRIILATYGVASVGINIPRIFNLVLLEPGKSFVRIIQSIGRGIRKADDKDFVNVWDITASTKYAKRHLTERKKFYKDAKYDFTIQKVKYQ